MGDGTVVPVSGGMTERQVTLIRDFAPDIIMVTSSSMLAILDEMERQGLDPARCSLKYGIFRGRAVDQRDAGGGPAGIDATDVYGLSEVMGPGVAQEAVETRDLTRLLPGTARTMRRMEKITGRTDDMIILCGVNLFPTQVEELILGVPALSPHFQLHLTRPGWMDAMTVHVERRPDATRHAAEAAGAQLSTLIKNIIGVSVAAVVQDPDTIERSLGKARRIIGERPR